MTLEEIVEYYTHLLASREKYGMNAQNITSGGDLVKDTITDLMESVIRELSKHPDPDTGLMKCDYCNGGGEQKPLFHENNYEPHTCMQSYIEISESSYGKKPLICVDLWDGANACAAFEINFCPMCGRKLEAEG